MIDESNNLGTVVWLGRHHVKIIQPKESELEAAFLNTSAPLDKAVYLPMSL